MRVKIGDLYLNVVVEGSGPPLLLVHGFPFDHTMWHEQLSALVGHFQMIAPDLRGFGDSDAPASFYSMDLYADDLAHLLDVLGQEKVVLAGLSMGGYIALAFQRRYPERLAGLVLADTQATADTETARAGRYAAIRTVQAEGVEAVVSGLLPKLFAPANFAAKRILREWVRAMMMRQSPAGVMGALKAMAERPDSTPGLAVVSCPTLVIVGEEDLLTPPAKAAALVAAIPGARLAVIPEAGHLTPLEAPEAFNRLLLENLDTGYAAREDIALGDV